MHAGDFDHIQRTAAFGSGYMVSNVLAVDKMIIGKSGAHCSHNNTTVKNKITDLNWSKYFFEHCC